MFYNINSSDSAHQHENITPLPSPSHSAILVQNNLRAIMHMDDANDISIANVTAEASAIAYGPTTMC